MKRHRGKPLAVRASKSKYVDRVLAPGDRVVIAAGAYAGKVGTIVAITVAVVRGHDNRRSPGERSAEVRVSPTLTVTALLDSLRSLEAGVVPRRPRMVY